MSRGQQSRPLIWLTATGMARFLSAVLAGDVSFAIISALLAVLGAPQ